jgi:hypothetical protein
MNVKLGSDNGRWMELVQDHVQWRDLVLADVDTWISIVRGLIT